MALYLIAFNNEWVADLTLEELREGQVRQVLDRGDDGRGCLHLQSRRSGRVDRQATEDCALAGNHPRITG
jgi:hypothetical protein